MNQPLTTAEWQKYIHGVPLGQLRSQAVAANTHSFIRRLLEDGMRMPDIEGVLRMYALQLRAAQIGLPEGGAFDLAGLVLGMDTHRTVQRKWPCWSR